MNAYPEGLMGESMLSIPEDSLGGDISFIGYVKIAINRITASCRRRIPVGLFT
jgi:hypothetical protein